MRIVIMAGLAAVLASCGGAASDTVTNAAATNDPHVDQGNVTAENGPPPVANSGTVDNSAVSLPAAALPATFRGRWGLMLADCTSTRGDAKGLLDISDTQLRFYESRATLGRIVDSDPSRIVADFDFSGEGQTWQRRMSLDVQDDGQVLVRREQGADAMPGPLRYRKCAA